VRITSNGSKRASYCAAAGNQQVQHAVVNLRVAATTSEDSNRELNNTRLFAAS
jgi:hypothetical protein